ncbi:MAG: VOC family protein [Acidimicrobiia bacterium]
MRLDHLVICVPDLDEAGRAFESAHGLVSTSGGRHRGHGTSNRIIPLGDAYLELVSVVDSEEASESQFGSWVAENSKVDHAVAGVCLRTESVSLVAEKLGLTMTSMNRVRPDGFTLAWRTAGIERLVADGFPFFIEWEVPEDQLPGRSPVAHPAGVVERVSLTMTGDTRLLGPWIQGASEVTVEEGRRSNRVQIQTRSRLIEI